MNVPGKQLFWMLGDMIMTKCRNPRDSLGHMDLVFFVLASLMKLQLLANSYAGMLLSLPTATGHTLANEESASCHGSAILSILLTVFVSLGYALNCLLNCKLSKLICLNQCMRCY